MGMVRSVLRVLDSDPQRIPTQAEDALLFAAIKAGVMIAECEHRLVRHHSRLCHHIAQRYAKPHNLDDAIMAAMEGLVIAMRRYDAARGTRFSTYAVPWITMKCRRATSDSAATIRIPEHMIIKQAKINRANVAHYRDHGIKPSRNTLSATTGLTLDQVDAATESLSVQPRSLDDMVATGVDVGFDRSAEDYAMDAQDVVILWDALSILSPESRDVVVRYYGLDGDDPETMSQLAARRGCSKQAIDDRLRHARAKMAKVLMPE